MFREVIIPHPQILWEFVGGFTRRSSALAESDGDKINAMPKRIVLASRTMRPKVFCENLC